MSEAVSQIITDLGKKNAEIEINLKAAMAATSETSLEAKSALSKAIAAIGDIEGIKARLDEAEQKLVQSVNRGTQDLKSLGDFAIESQGFKDFMSSRVTNGKVEVKNTLLSANAQGVSDTTLTQAQRGDLVGGQFRILKLEDLLPSGTIESSSFEFPRENVFVNGAEMRADGAPAGEATLGFELVQRNVQEISHFMPISKNAARHSSILKAYVEKRLVYGVNFKAEQAIFSGSGVGLEVYGMTSDGSCTPFVPTAGESILDAVSRALVQVQLADFSADGIVMHPATWGSLSRLKTSTGEYLLQSPLQGQITPTLYGVPVVVTAACPVGKVLVGNMAMAYMVLNNANVTIEIANQHADCFIKGVDVILATRRLVVAGMRPASVVYGDLLAA